MQLTKINLEADRKAYAEQLAGLQSRIAYIDQLIAFVDKPEPVEQVTGEQPVVPNDNEQGCCGGGCHEEPSGAQDAQAA